MQSLAQSFRISSNPRLLRVFHFRELHEHVLCHLTYDQRGLYLSRSSISSPYPDFTSAEFSSLATARNQKCLIDIQNITMFPQVSVGISCHLQGWGCPGPTFGGLTLGRSISSAGRFSASSQVNGFSFVGTSSKRRRRRTLGSSEVDQPSGEGQPGQDFDHNVLKETIYDSLETNKITPELFPELNFPLEGNFYPKLVPLVAKKISDFLEEEGGEERIPELLEHLSLKLSPHLVGEVLRLQKDSKKSHNFFNWARNQPGFEHTAHTYDLMFWTLVSRRNDRPGNLVLAAALLEEMLSKNVNPGTRACNVLIDRLCKNRNVGMALRLMKKLETDDLPDVVTYNTVINGLGKAGLFNDVFEVLDRMQEKGFTPNTLTYNSIIYGLGDAGRWQEACKLFEELPDRGITPNVVTYNSLIVGLFKCRQVDQAFKFYGLMGLRGCQPDRITHNTLIDGLVKSGRINEAWKIFDYMKEQGVKPDVITWNTLIGGLVTAGKVDEALKLVPDMKKSGCAPNLVTNRLLVEFDQEDILAGEVNPLNDGVSETDESGKSENDSGTSVPGDRSEEMMESEMRVSHI